MREAIKSNDGSRVASQRCVLIVLAEDNLELPTLLADGLERVGFAVVRAENGADLVGTRAREARQRTLTVAGLTSRSA
jgi:hypothetical protein